MSINTPHILLDYRMTYCMSMTISLLKQCRSQFVTQQSYVMFQPSYLFGSSCLCMSSDLPTTLYSVLTVELVDWSRWAHAALITHSSCHHGWLLGVLGFGSMCCLYRCIPSQFNHTVQPFRYLLFSIPLLCILEIIYWILQAPLFTLNWKAEDPMSDRSLKCICCTYQRLVFGITSHPA